mmetsp:Transcript_2044/g.7299  ORF Transcript_2044/g.7299 Transcript_2044/m.7299 type:complete len:151 (+) Transcript_2044:66-518(+)|eukprot:CAMPEP_0182913532 /NCGR_PEP_ID=MMETSP0034_2-20130328/38090_1 /TAXON_ID=156128 /ORGANISM="Nephroselmis pyriformis, Strain CCMP717" /LENGTH=150 /DNA_ID=CAMNT_0025050259 /DNA_START=72 /DNA_END=524 /DNA_ORIENTATION=+
MEGEKNFVHEDENWRQRVRYENQTSREFNENWGFLTQNREDMAAANRRDAYATRLVKYFNPGGGNWTVEVKRIPERRPQTTGGVMRPSDYPSGTAMHSVTSMHKLRLEEIDKANPAFTTTGRLLGARKSLEQFGICEHGHKSTRTKYISG